MSLGGAVPEGRGFRALCARIKSISVSLGRSRSSLKTVWRACLIWGGSTVSGIPLTLIFCLLPLLSRSPKCLLMRIKWVAWDETAISKCSTALSLFASALSVCDKRSNRDRRSAFRSVVAEEKVFLMSAAILVISDSCVGDLCRQVPLPCLLRPTGSPHCVLPRVASAPFWLQKGLGSGVSGAQKALVCCGILGWRTIGVDWSLV